MLPSIRAFPLNSFAYLEEKDRDVRMRAFIQTGENQFMDKNREKYEAAKDFVDNFAIATAGEVLRIRPDDVKDKLDDERDNMEDLKDKAGVLQETINDCKETIEGSKPQLQENEQNQKQQKQKMEKQKRGSEKDITKIEQSRSMIQQSANCNCINELHHDNVSILIPEGVVGLTGL